MVRGSLAVCNGPEGPALGFLPRAMALGAVAQGGQRHELPGAGGHAAMGK